MSNAIVHQFVAAAAVGASLLVAEQNRHGKKGRPLIGAVLAAGFTCVPDALEPAIHPHHRQFFHSVAFAALLGIAVRRVYHWKPDNQREEALRFVALTSMSAYLIHLLLDAGTPKSLPLIGKL